MLTSITPLGERGRGHRWVITAAWLVVGHLVGGAALGLLLGGSGALIGRAGLAVDEFTTTVVIGAAVVLGAAFDIGDRQLPGRRQVDERWLTTYRGWVYGGGFGVQLGFGLVTVVNTALVGSVLIAGLLLPFGQAVALGVLYGGIRGISATANGWVASVADLRRLHRWIDRADRPARWIAAGAGTMAAVAAVMVS